MTMAPVSPRPLARVIDTTVATSMMISSMTPTTASPPARRATPGGNRSTGRNRRCSRQVGEHGHHDQCGDAQRGADRQDQLGRQRQPRQRQPRSSGTKAR